ncbi:MAG: SGNH/GDSL hydrolase family protein, partial [Flavobacteriaceae bacterium]
ALPKYRQATAEDLLVLPSSSIIGEVNMENVAALMSMGASAAQAGQASVNGVSFPLADKWVLTPQEQAEIKTAIDAYNGIIKASATAAGLAFFDANQFMQQLAAGGITDGKYKLTSNLVTGGAFSLDGVHPTPRGYALISNLMMKTLDATYGTNFEASGNLLDLGDYPTNFSPALQ